MRADRSKFNKKWINKRNRWERSN